MGLSGYVGAGVGAVGIVWFGIATQHGAAQLAMLIVAWVLAAVITGLAIGAAIDAMDDE